jgi:hypothetical protein
MTVLVHCFLLGAISVLVLDSVLGTLSHGMRYDQIHDHMHHHFGRHHLGRNHHVGPSGLGQYEYPGVNYTGPAGEFVVKGCGYTESGLRS